LNKSSCYDVITIQVPIIATGIASQDINSIRVYPNPVKNSITIALGNAFKKDSCELVVNDLIGRAVLQQTLAADNAKREFTIDTSTLVSGVYTLTVQGKEGKFISRIIKE